MLNRTLIFLTVVLVYAGLTCLGPGQDYYTFDPRSKIGLLSLGQKSGNTYTEPAAKNITVKAANISVGDAQLPKVKQPKIYRSVYLNNHHGRKLDKVKKHIADIKKYGLNAVVLDVQPRMVDKETLALYKKEGIYTIARVVCFLHGLKRIRPTQSHMTKILGVAQTSAKNGFDEIQLDYIRYADSWGRKKIGIKKRYEVLADILEQFRRVLVPYQVKLGADVFGRIPFNKNDIIGQRIENFAEYMDVIYPMLYPSHFTGDRYRQSRPYETIYEGVDRSMHRVKANPMLESTKIVAYIQAFKWRYKKSGMSFHRYIYDQVVASERAGHGWVAWNPRSDYTHTWKALDLLAEKGHSLIPLKQVVYKSYNPKRKN